MYLKQREPLSCSLMTQIGNHPKHLKSYLSLIYIKNNHIFLVNNSEGIGIRSIYGKSK